MSYAAEVNNLTRDYYLLLTFPRTLPAEAETTLEEVRRDLYQGRDAYNAESIIYGIAEYLFCLCEELTEQDAATKRFFDEAEELYNNVKLLEDTTHELHG